MPEEKKPAPSANKDFFDVMGDFYKNDIGSPLALVAFILLIVVLGFALLMQSNIEFHDAVIGYLVYTTAPYLPAVKTIFTLITMIWISGIIYLFLKTRDLNSIEYHKYKSINTKADEQKENNAQWQNVLDYLSSDNPAEWKIAILEADSMLDEVVKKAGGVGDTLGERLKSIDPEGFNSLNLAWDAHKVRNMIAHDNASYQLTKREAKRVIDLYEIVFKEFQYI